MLTLPDGVDCPEIVELAYGADLADPPASWPWVDYTADALGADVAITRGRSPGAQHAEHSRCPLLLASPDGRHHPLVATGPNYPHVLRNTPIRVRLHPGIAETVPLLVDDFTRTSVDSLGTAPNGMTWADSGTTGTLASDFQVNGTSATHRVDAANRYRRSRLAVAADQVDITVAVVAPLATGGDLEVGVVCRQAPGSIAYYLFRAAITSAQAINATISTVAPDSTIGSASTGLTHAAATTLYIRAQAFDTTLRMKVWQGATEPTAWLITATDSQITAAGDAGIRTGRAAGNTNSASVTAQYEQITIATMPIRFGGYADAFRPIWPAGVSGPTARVAIAGSGILRRLSQGSKAVRSPVYRDVMSVQNDPYRVAYWPVEDLADATRVASPMTGVDPMTVVGPVSFSSYASPGSSPFATLGAGGSLIGVIPPFTPTNAEAKIVTLWGVPDAGLTDLTVVQRVIGTGTVARWDLIYGVTGGGSMSLAAYNGAGALIDSISFAAGSLNGTNFLTSVEMRVVGADISVVLLFQRINVADPQGSLLYPDTFTGQTLGVINQIRIAPNGDAAGLAVGHIGVSNDTGGLAALGDAIVGYATETPAQRFARLCVEENVPARVEAGDETNALQMGPQPVAPLINLLRECEATEVGILDEMPFGLRFVARSARYNQAVALALDTTNGEVKLPFEPVYDDQQLRNDVEVRRTGGSSARHEATGDLSPDGTTGRYDGGSTPVNTHTDDPLDDIAAWLAHVGTVNEYRLPALTWDLATHPDLIAPWLAADVGSRVTAQTELVEFPHGVVDQVLDGYTEVLGVGPVWTITAMGSPASPWDVAVIEGAGPPTAPKLRLDTGGAQLAGAVDEDDTTMSVATTGSQLWTTTATFPADFPFDVDVGGEQIEVTAIVGAASPQTFTVRRSRNGVIKPHSTGAAVRLWRPAPIAL